jgi:hypothetical protein
MASVTWLDRLPSSISGTKILGAILVQIPADANTGDSWLAHLTAVGASLVGTELAPNVQSGPDATLTVKLHDVAVTQFAAPTSLKSSTRPKSLPATVANLSTSSETVTVRLLRNGVEVQSKVVSMTGMSSTAVTFSYAFTAADKPSVTLTVEAVIAEDEDLSNNSKSATVIVK